MSDIMEYKCPACGGAMEFDSKSQRMKCPFCDTEMDIAELQEEMPESQQDAAQGGPVFQNAGSVQWQEDETKGMKVYSCESCGGEIVAEETTGASTCPFCGNRIVMQGQFAGDLKPDMIIPFQLDKKAAKEAYLKHLKGKKFLPGVFKNENHIDEMKGLYVPFWVFDADIQAEIRYSAQKVRRWTADDKEYTKTEFYEIERGGNISFAYIPTDASKKMDDSLMESIEPYDAAAAVPFQSAFLAGYAADRYDVKMEERFQRAAERIKTSAENAYRDTVTGYQSVSVVGSNVNITNASYKYAMYPVWILSTTWRKNTYLFAMNAQTGKLVGNLPVDKGAFWRFVGIRSVVIGTVLYALMWAILYM